jgi:3-deoxy-D-manno-octulosonic-acid transferase
MILFYRGLTRLLYLIVYPWARHQAARGSEVWRGRLGLDLPTEPVDIWMHAASVGEIRILGNLIAFLFKARPTLNIRVTAVTRTGVETARAILPRRVSISYLPLDVRSLCERILQQLQPKMIIVAETEIWPNLIGAAAGKSIPMVLVNGRMTERSQRRYQIFSHTIRRLLATYDRFFFKSEGDRDRFLTFGCRGYEV